MCHPNDQACSSAPPIATKRSGRGRNAAAQCSTPQPSLLPPTLPRPPPSTHLPHSIHARFGARVRDAGRDVARCKHPVGAAGAAEARVDRKEPIRRQRQPRVSEPPRRGGLGAPQALVKRQLGAVGEGQEPRLDALDAGALVNRDAGGGREARQRAPCRGGVGL